MPRQRCRGQVCPDCEGPGSKEGQSHTQTPPVVANQHKVGMAWGRGKYLSRGINYPFHFKIIIFKLKKKVYNKGCKKIISYSQQYYYIESEFQNELM